MSDEKLPLYAYTIHPDRAKGVPRPRHLVRPDNYSKTLCGRDVAWLWDYATPLVEDCRRCELLRRGNLAYAERG